MSLADFELPADAIRRIVAHDGALFSNDPAVAAEASSFMGWTHLAEQAADILPEIEDLAAEVRAEKLTDVVLLGMGGSSLAALVIGSVLGPGSPRFHVLDTVAPVTIEKTLAETDPATTLHLVCSKSGGTIEPNALYAIFRNRADEVLGHEAAGLRFVALTDPGSSLEHLAEEQFMRACIATPPEVGGRYSALSAFGLVPAAVLGIDVRALVESALEMEREFTQGDGDLLLAKTLAAAHARGADKLTILAPPRLRVFGLWIEQLVAESLGKHGKGIVPIVDLAEREDVGANELRCMLSRSGRLYADGSAGEGETLRYSLQLHDPHELGAWFVLWEYSVALAGSTMGLDPFNQPNVAEAKAATNAVLDGSLKAPAPQGEGHGVRMTFAGGFPKAHTAARFATTALARAFTSREEGDYIALLAYLPDDDRILAPLRETVAAVARHLQTPICLELGPRYLHSTGQLHKGGRNNGLFVMLTTRDETDIEIPGWPFGLRDLHIAQAEGDLTALAAHGRRVLRLDLPDAEPETIEDFCTVLLEAGELGA
jgi:glucose-6-phosphate isomerase